MDTDWKALSTFSIELLDRILWLVVIVLVWRLRKPLAESLAKLIKNARLTSIRGPAGVGADLEYVDATVKAKEAEIVDQPVAKKQVTPVSASNGSNKSGVRTLWSSDKPWPYHFTSKLTDDPSVLSTLIATLAGTATGSWIVPAEPKKVERDLVRHAPIGAIIAGWKQLEEFLLDAGRRWEATIAGNSPRHLNSYLKLLLNQEVLDPSMLESIERFRKLRNDAAHGTDITVEQAESYLEIRDRLIEVIKEKVETRRLEQILAQLGVSSASEIALGLSLPHQGSFTAKEMRRLAQWYAAVGDTKISISGADVQMLIKLGALHDPTLAKALGLSANPEADRPTS